MKILYSWLKDFVPIKESPEKLAELLSFSSYETIVDKKIGRDAILEISLLPNRVADSSSHLGIAREVGLLCKRKIRFVVKPPEEGTRRIENFVRMKVQGKNLARRYSLRGMKGVKVGESPLWLKKRLKTCGLRPINNIVDATNYVMLELGQPLHAFDADQIADSRGQYADKRGSNQRQSASSLRRSAVIIVRQAKKGEKIETIERKTYELKGLEILIADPKGPLGLAGIKGGRRGEITKKTKNIVIESANFDPVTTRMTSKTHNLKTDASWRFENNLDPNLTVTALDRVVNLIQEVAGGEILRGVLNFYPKKVLPWPIVVDVGYISRLIGQEISEQKIISLVKPFCEKIQRLKPQTHAERTRTDAESSPRQSASSPRQSALVLHIKTYRRDLKYPEDIAEEIARLIGYNNIKAEAPITPLVPATKNESMEFREILKDHLVSLGLTEVQNYSFISQNDADKMGFLGKNSFLIEVANPISREAQFLRPDLFAGLMKNVRDNLRFFSKVEIFEIGKQYRWQKDRKTEESWRVAGAIAGSSAKPKNLFFEAKGVLESLFERLGLDREDYDIRASSNNWYFEEGGHVGIWLDGKEIAKVGVVRSNLLYGLGIDVPAAYWRLDLEPLMLVVEEEHEFEPLHKYPDVLRDISMIISQERRIDEIEQEIFATSPKYLEEVELFDIFEGDGLPKGKKSLAFHLIFRAPDRTLTSEEVEKEVAKIRKALENLGAQIR